MIGGGRRGHSDMRIGSCFGLLLVVAGLTMAPQSGRADQTCSKELGASTRLVIAEVPDLSGHQATVTLYERAGTGDPWQAGQRFSAVIGRKGFGWAWAFRNRATTQAPIKREGDGKTPGGIFPLGTAFGFEGSALPGYLRLRQGREFCVSDVKSASYNQILPEKPAGDIEGEDMGATALYRQGLFIDYPSDAAERAGSCIFVHVWRSPGSPTAGCVALAQGDVEFVQRWSAGNSGHIAILPRAEAESLVTCLTSAK